MTTTVETYCDCGHRRGLHHTAPIRDTDGSVFDVRRGCALVGCPCDWFTQYAQHLARAISRTA